MKKSIRAKILTSSLSVCVVSLLLSAAVSLTSSFFLTRLASRSNLEIGSLASENSERLLVEQAVANVTELAVAKAENVRRRLSEFISVLENICDYTGYLYAQREGLAAREIPAFGEIIAAGRGGELALQMLLSPGVAPEDVRGELEFYGNMEPVLHAAMNGRKQITSIYLTTGSGINIGYDANTKDKLGIDSFDGRTTPWYREAWESGELYLSDAYQDMFGRGLTLTLSVPLRAEGLSAVVGMDILIEDINRDVLGTDIGNSGYAMLIGPGGSMISAPGLSRQGESAASWLGTGGEAILGHILDGRHGAESSRINERDVSVAYAPIGISGWALVVVVPLEDVVAPAIRAKTIIRDITSRAEMDMKRQTVGAALSLAALFTLMTALAALIVFRLSERITRPLVRLCGDVKEIGGGRLDYVCEISTGDELEELGKTFEAMIVRLNGYIRNLAMVTADRERISAELNVAARIQTGMLPRAFPKRGDFEIHADMRAAKEVGGDFYDFFLTEENRLTVVIADVSGKGVPAALFMVIAKTLIRNYCKMGLEPAAALEAANAQLCENNEAGLFVTAFLGTLELDTGRFVYANAGHNPPAVFRRGGWEWLRTPPGFVLAGLEGTSFKQRETELSAGDRLLLYTDGVTEAQDREAGLYSEERLLSLLSGLGGEEDARQIIERVNADVDRFADGAPQADDITILAMEYFPEG